MKIHILQHESFESPAVIADWANYRGHELSYTKFYENDILPDKNEFDWLIIMGGPMSTNDEEEYPWLKSEKIFIKEVIDAKKKALGICLGAQLIAASLGCKVYRNKYKEIGWMNVHLTEAGIENALFKSLPGNFTVCQWHGDTFDLPEGAVLLAESGACRNQAFIYNQCVIGLQFHLEFNEDTIKDLIKNCKKELIKDTYVQTENEIIQNLKLLNETNNILLRIMDGIEKIS